MGTRRDTPRQSGDRPRCGTGAVRLGIAAAALLFAASAAQADGWLFSGAEVKEGFFGTSFFEAGQSAPLSLTCAWRKDGDSAPLFLDDGGFEGVSPTQAGHFRLEISAEIAGGYGEEAPELTLRLNGEPFPDLTFTGDLIGYLYYAELPVDGPFIEAMKAGGPLELQSSLAPEWSTEVDEAGRKAVTQLQEFCGRRQPQG